MIKFRVIATNHSVRDSLTDRVPSLVPKAWIVARLVVSVAKVEIPVLPIGLPQYLVLFQGKRSCAVEVAFKADEVAHGRERVIKNDIQSATVHLVDRGAPHINRSKMWLEDRQVQRRILIVSPRLIDEW